MDRSSDAIIAMGANLPSAERSASEALRSACGILHDEPDISITAISRFWRTPAVPQGSGPDYVNAAATLRTSLTPKRLLTILHRIEADFGRDRSGGRWSARVLDLDLVDYKNRVLPNPQAVRAWMDLPMDRQRRETPDRLILPHPRLQDRGFVLAPLAEIAPFWRHPLTGRSTVEMLDDLDPAARQGMQPLGPDKGAAILDISAPRPQ